jgi:hypothetical protein
MHVYYTVTGIAWISKMNDPYISEKKKMRT